MDPGGSVLVSIADTSVVVADLVVRIQAGCSTTNHRVGWRPLFSNLVGRAV